ncbi:MAG: hypothetical protein RH949_09840 [Coleofasciculus sp. A1-SPW-01]|uniref:hypothetical protein n=1 Tax=Coleofasciculus sp. A1-SPW-01 TaxID=3070819 RepID=UPI003302496A
MILSPLYKCFAATLGLRQIVQIESGSLILPIDTVLTEKGIAETSADKISPKSPVLCTDSCASACANRGYLSAWASLRLQLAGYRRN